MSEQHLDHAIDRAVREMMNVDADPAFRARVLARLDDPAPRRLSWTSLAAIAAGAAAVLLTFFLLRTPASRESVPTVAEVHSSAAPSVSQAPAPAPANPFSAAPRLSERVTPRRAVQTPRPSTNVTQSLARGALTATAVADDEPDAPIDALHQIDPITIAPLDRTPIAPPAIVVAPLTPITELRIAPLSPRIERD
jgi:hypothetical protein